MHKAIKNVGIIPNKSKSDSLKKALKTAELFYEKGVNVHAPDWLGFSKAVSNDTYKDADVVVVFGGDGTVLNAARKASLTNIPILSINTGKIGYLTSLEKEESFDIDSFISGNFAIERRMMLDCEIIREDKVVFFDTALNEFVVSKGSLSRMMDFRLYCGTKDYMEYRADAMIVSTPTGSTAYSMSAGGAVIDPALHCIQVTPICPYAMSGARHMIFSPDSTVTVEVYGTNNGEAWLTGDGNSSFHLQNNDKIVLKCSKHEASLVKLNSKTFCDVLVSKFNG